MTEDYKHGVPIDLGPELAREEGRHKGVINYQNKDDERLKEVASGYLERVENFYNEHYFLPVTEVEWKDYFKVKEMNQNNEPVSRLDQQKHYKVTQKFYFRFGTREGIKWWLRREYRNYLKLLYKEEEEEKMLQEQREKEKKEQEKREEAILP